MSALDTYELDGCSLNTWHMFLTTDQETGEATGHLHAPCSRYGRDGDECAWWAIAGQVVYVEANGDSDSTEESLDWLMGLAVNDHDDLATLVLDYWYAIPAALRKMLGTKREVKRLAS